LREPTFADLLELGDPRRPHRSGGVTLLAKRVDVIGRYLQRLSTPRLSTDFLRRLPIEEALRLEAAVLSFFQEAGSPEDILRVGRELAFNADKELASIGGLTLPVLFAWHRQALIAMAERKKTAHG
jgi:hypothetical protein